MKRSFESLLFAALLAWPLSLLAGEDINILFLGNSFTQRHNLPDLVERILEEGDPETGVNTARVIYGGQNMFKHFTYYFSQSFIEQSTITPGEIAARIETMKGFLESGSPPDQEEWDAHWRSLGLARGPAFAEIHPHIRAAIRNHEQLLANNPKTEWDYVVLQSWRDVSPDIENKVKDGKDPDGGEPRVVFVGEPKSRLQEMAAKAVREFESLAKGE